MKRGREQPEEGEAAPKVIVQVDRSKRLFGSMLSHLKAATAQPQPRALHPAAAISKPGTTTPIDVQTQLIIRQIAEVKSQLERFKNEFGPRSTALVTSTEPRLLWLPGRHSQTTQEELSARERDYQKELENRERETEKKVLELEKRLSSSHNTCN
jgi:hypothetical protein